MITTTDVITVAVVCGMVVVVVYAMARVLDGPGVRGLAVLLVAVLGFTTPMDALRAGAIGGFADLILLLGLLVVLAERLTTRDPLPLRLFSPTIACAAVVGSAGLVGTIWAYDPGSSVLNLVRFSLATVGTLVLVACATRNRRDVRLFSWAYVLGTTASAAYSFTNVNPYNGRSPGLASHANVLGATVGFAVAIVVGLILTAAPWGRVLGGVCTVVMFGGILNSGSRAAVIEVAVALVVLIAATRNRWLTASVLLLLVCAAVALGALWATGTYTPSPASAIGRVFDSGQAADSNFQRRVIMNETLEDIKAHPLTGVGFADATVGHNLYLQVIEAAGILGALAYIALAVSIIRPLAHARRDPLVAGFLAMYIGYLVAGLFSPQLWDRWLWFPIAVGLAAATYSAPPAVGSSMNGRGRANELRSRERRREVEADSPASHPAADQ